MPYGAPRKTKDGKYVLPKKGGGLHKSSKGKIIKFKSAKAAAGAARAIMANEGK